MKKGDLFVIDVDAYVSDKISYFRGCMPTIAEKARENAEPLRGKVFRVHRIENYGQTIIFDVGTGITGIKSVFCRRIKEQRINEALST